MITTPFIIQVQLHMALQPIFCPDRYINQVQVALFLYFSQHRAVEHHMWTFKDIFVLNQGETRNQMRLQKKISVNKYFLMDNSHQFTIYVLN